LKTPVTAETLFWWEGGGGGGGSARPVGESAAESGFGKGAESSARKGRGVRQRGSKGGLGLRDAKKSL